ncbi:phosphatidylinositol 4-phosphate 3-kinase C2 domain-containing subunit alpha-like [Clytia hemisphaerica]|uniref:Phosphatidylinositol-4-phosphate 3-kinase n=1 Tax=Clytia hemisphaerica TaxID=252671 RepID=A0A7M5WV51_9CNID|eukprot:TCONS_00069681-protein
MTTSPVDLISFDEFKPKVPPKSKQRTFSPPPFPPAVKREPDIRRVILSELEYYRPSSAQSNNNYASNLAFQDFTEGANNTNLNGGVNNNALENDSRCVSNPDTLINNETESTQNFTENNNTDGPPLPPKKYGRSRANALERQVSLTRGEKPKRDDELSPDVLSKSMPDTLYLFDPFLSESFIDEPTIVRGSQISDGGRTVRSKTMVDDKNVVPTFDLLQFDIDIDETKDETSVESEVKLKSPTYRLSERRKVKTLSPEDLQRFERSSSEKNQSNINKETKTKTLPARPPRPKNRFSCPPNVIAGIGENSHKNGSDQKDSSTAEQSNNKNDIYFKTALFQRTEERNEEAVAFSNAIAKLRKFYKHEDKSTNIGCIAPSKIANKALLDSTVEFTIYFDPDPKPKTMTCKLSLTPTEVIHKFFTECYNGGKSFELDIIAEQYVLKFVGATTCLSEQCPLCDYVTIQESIKYGYRIELVLVRTGFVNLDFKRDAEDDTEDCHSTYFKYYFEEKQTSSLSISEQGLSVLLETYDSEAARLMQDVSESHKVTYHPQRIIQVVKAITKSLAQVELLTVQEGVNMLLSLKKFTAHSKSFSAQRTDGRKEVVEFMNPIHFDHQKFHSALQTLTQGVHSLIQLYCKFFNTDFKIQDFGSNNIKIDQNDIFERIDPRTIDDRFTVRIGSIHRIPHSWKTTYTEFEIEASLYYGGNLTATPKRTAKARVCVGFFEHIRFHELLEFDVSVRNIPRESKVTFKLIGLSPPKKGGDGRTTLGWVSSNVYDHQGFLMSGSRLFGLLSEVHFNPVATCATGYIQKPETVILKTDFQVYHTEVLFPQPVLITQTSINGNPSTLSEAEMTYVTKILRKDSRVLTQEERYVIWKSRYGLCHLPYALKHVLASCPSWDSINVTEVHTILSMWEALSPNEAIEFLQADFPDKTVRETAVLWLSSITDYDLVDYLPELVQAIKYEAYHDSALAQFVIKRSLSSPSVAHFLFWHLKYYTGDLQFSQRFQIVLSGLLSACGRRMRAQLQQQDNLMVELAQVSLKVKACKEPTRQLLLVKELHKVNESNVEFPVRSPIDPSLKLGEILPESSSYFSSHTVPLKICMRNVDRRGRDINFIFKIGDDLRKDLVTLLMFRVMNKLWLNEGLDLKMMLYNVLPTGPLSGLIEIIPNAATFREIHIQHGLTGSFKDDSLILWLQRFNTTEQDYHRAIDNFTYSAAGYCVATYLLGIGDRHNDNIMLTKNGHLFHIDFSKFMGDVQKFGAISRDRVPFVLTPDMAYVINNGITPTQNFQKFIEYCCQAFNIIRRNKHVILNLLGLMVYSGIPYLSEKEDLLFVRKNLQLDLTDEEATMYFTRLIESSLSSRSTQLNFFIHNIAHMKNTSEATLGSAKSSPLFSFSNKTHTQAKDGVINSARIVDFQKRYLPEKHYVFVINVTRKGVKEPKFVFRRFEDFQELHAKLSYKFNPFTGTIMPELPARIVLGRSQIREVAHRRRYELDNYLVALSKLEDVWSSDILYTFLHSYIKDTEEARRFAEYVELLADGPKTRIGGKIKVSIGYKNKALHVLVMHCSGLVPDRVQGLADSFVKVRIIPDPLHHYKRKTRICRKTLHPTFNETLIFEASWEMLRKRVLQITVWDSNHLMDKEFLGGVNCYLSTFDVKKTQNAWFPLTDIQIS